MRLEPGAVTLQMCRAALCPPQTQKDTPFPPPMSRAPLASRYSPPTATHPAGGGDCAVALVPSQGTLHIPFSPNPPPLCGQQAICLWKRAQRGNQRHAVTRSSEWGVKYLSTVSLRRKPGASSDQYAMLMSWACGLKEACNLHWGMSPAIKAGQDGRDGFYFRDVFDRALAFT